MKILTDESRMPFGAYKLDRMRNVPARYLLWIWEDGLWDLQALKARAENPTLTDIQRAQAENRIAVHRYIKENFSALESEKHDVIITHRPQ
jgi:hypothetical protein